MTRTTLKTLMAAVMAIFLMTGGAMAVATITIDTSTTDATTSVSEIQSGTTITTFNASPDVSYRIEVNASDGNSYKANLRVKSTERVYHTMTFTNDTKAGGGQSHFNATFTESDLSDVPMVINENVTMQAVIYNTSASGTEDNTTIDFFIENTDERSVHEVRDGVAIADVETKEPPLYKAWRDDYETTDVENDNVEINGSNTTIVYTLAETNVTDTFDNATEDITDSGTMTFMKATLDNGATDNVPVFYKDTPDWYDLEDFGSYGIYDPDADTVEFTLSDDQFDGESQADSTLTSDVYRITDLWTVMSMAGGTDNIRESASVALQMVM